MRHILDPSNSPSVRATGSAGLAVSCSPGRGAASFQADLFDPWVDRVLRYRYVRDWHMREARIVRDQGSHISLVCHQVSLARRASRAALYELWLGRSFSCSLLRRQAS